MFIHLYYWLSGAWGFVYLWRGRSYKKQLFKCAGCSSTRRSMSARRERSQTLDNYQAGDIVHLTIQTKNIFRHLYGWILPAIQTSDPEWRRSVPFAHSEAVMKRCAASRSRVSRSTAARVPLRSCQTWMTVTLNSRSWCPVSLRTSPWARWRFFSM